MTRRYEFNDREIDLLTQGLAQMRCNIETGTSHLLAEDVAKMSAAEAKQLGVSSNRLSIEQMRAVLAVVDLQEKLQRFGSPS